MRHAQSINHSALRTPHSELPGGHPMAEEGGLFSIGIEEEFQIVDPATGDLRAHIQQILRQAGQHSMSDQIKPEMLQSMVETISKVCRNIDEARAEVYK